MNSHKRPAGIAAVLLVSWLGALACGTDAPLSAPAVGALSVQLELTGIRIKEIAYTITMDDAVYRTGRFVIDGEGVTFSAVIGAMPVYDNYEISLVGSAKLSATGLTTECKGSGSFGVVAAQTTAVSVPLHCEGPPKPAAMKACPRIDAVRALPNEAPVGKAVLLKCDAADPGPGGLPIGYRWTADRGVVADATSATASYQCVQAGIAAIVLIVSNGDATCPEESAVVYVTCLDVTVGSTAGTTGMSAPASASAAGRPAPAGAASRSTAPGAGAAGR